MPTPESQHPPQQGKSPWVVRLIGLGKLCKAAALILAAIFAFKLIDGNIEDKLNGWIHALHLDTGNHFVRDLLNKALGVDPKHFLTIGIVMAGYGGLFAVEGVGLLCLQHWAEWLTVVSTGLLIPLEVYEIAEHATALRIIVLILNIAIEIYLIVRLKSEHAGRKEKRRERRAAAA